jgi:hypothetical protein
MRCRLIRKQRGEGQLVAEHLMFNVILLSPYPHLVEGASLSQKLRWMEDEILYFN